MMKRAAVLMAFIPTFFLTWWPGKVHATLETLRLDGTDDRVVVANAPALNPSAGITIEAWIRPLTVSGCQTIVGKDYAAGYWLGICFGVLRYYASGLGTSVDGFGALPVGEWSHVAVTFDRNTRHYYINGVLDLQDDEDISVPMPVNLADFGIGGEADGASLFEFAGDIAEVRLWGVARHQQDLRRDMVRQVDPPAEGLIAVWHLEGSAGEALGNFPGTVRGDASFLGGTAPPVPHGPMRIPRLAVTPGLDGTCSAENGPLRVPIWYDDMDPAFNPGWARIGATDTHLSVCMEGMPTRGNSPSAFASVYIDPGADGGLFALPDDFRVNFMENERTSNSESGTGGGGFFPPGPLGFGALASFASEFAWSAEFIIRRSLLSAEPEGQFGLEAIHHWRTRVGDDHGWPVDFFWDRPDHWETAYIDDTLVPPPDSGPPGRYGEPFAQPTAFGERHHHYRGRGNRR